MRPLGYCDGAGDGKEEEDEDDGDDDGDGVADKLSSSSLPQ